MMHDATRILRMCFTDTPALQMAKTQKNKATSGHLGLLKVRHRQSVPICFKQ